MSVCLVNSLVTAQRYASMICAVALCPCLSVCLLQVGVLSKWPNEASWFLTWELPFTCPTLYYEILVPLKIRVTSVWNFVQNCGPRKFFPGK